MDPRLPRSKPDASRSRAGAAPSALFLVVVRGSGEGARLALGDAPRIVGRARDADLVLGDPKVSRKHLEIVCVDGGARVRRCEGAARVRVRGEVLDEAIARVGDALVIGDTVLTIADRTPSARVEVTNVATLLDDGGGSRELAAIFWLNEALDAAPDVAAVGAAVARWAPRVGARRVALVHEGEADATEDAALLVGAESLGSRARPEGDGTDVAIHVASDPTAHLVASLGGDAASAQTHRLLAVAARVVASALARVRRVATLEASTDDLRRLALGSARGFLGDSPAAVEVARVLPKLAASSATVLVLGESGTGKTFLARLLHEQGPRAREPFRVINCAAVPEHLLEGELFGHEKGAFTGATDRRTGAFEAVGRGTLLLDEIAELPLASQAKLLRALEERRFERLGSNQTLALHARVLAATNRDLKELVQRGAFRADLFFRVSVVTVRVPALRDRGDDLVLLAQRVLADLAPDAGRRVRGFSGAATAAMRAYAWPGNVRELRNAIEHALVLGEGELIEPADLPEGVRGAAAGVAKAASDDPSIVRLPERLDVLEARAIEAALRATNGNRARAAVILGINRATLFKKLKEGV